MLRVERGLCQEALAADAEVDRSYVGRPGRAVENPTVDLLDRLAGALGANLSDFFQEHRSGKSFPKPLRGGRRKNREQVWANLVFVSPH
jgi:transcriptional regulator with XRE-family HTH domain